MSRLLSLLVAGLVFAGDVFIAAAEQLRDPTRPPTGQAAVTKAISTKPRPAQLILQTVLISSDRRHAVISGRVMSIGDTYRGYRLEEIRETEVVMKGAKGPRRLQLYPAVNKVNAAMAATPNNEKGLE